MGDFVVNDKLKEMSEKTSTSRCLYKSNPDKLNRGLSSLASAIEYVFSDDYKKTYLESLSKAGVLGPNTILRLKVLLQKRQRLLNITPMKSGFKLS